MQVILAFSYLAQLQPALSYYEMTPIGLGDWQLALAEPARRLAERHGAPYVSTLTGLGKRVACPSL